MTDEQRDELLVRIDERIKTMVGGLDKLNGRVTRVEIREGACPIDLPKQVSDLKTRADKQDGAIAIAKWLGGGGGLGGLLALAAQLLSMVK